MEHVLQALRGRSLAVLTGAGISTESGIPDYRGPGTARRARNPIQARAFLSDAAERQRYWARSMIGWPRVASAVPNRAHYALVELEARGASRGLITQNVDGLHQAAGATSVIELHGALAEVVCLVCGAIEPRAELQERLHELNRDWQPCADNAEQQALAAPDGDAELERGDGFWTPDCRRCRGTLKPNVVFFGENVPRPRVDRAFAVVDDADALLVIGTSLTVYSGYRFVRRAAELAMPIAIINRGETRGDALASARVDGPAGELVPQLVEALARS